MPELEPLYEEALARRDFAGASRIAATGEKRAANDTERTEWTTKLVAACGRMLRMQ